MENVKSSGSPENEVGAVSFTEAPAETHAQLESTGQTATEVASQAPAESPLTKVLALLGAQSEALANLKELVDSRLSSDEAKERAIHALSDELNFYRDEFVAQSQKGILIDLIVLYDNIKQAINLLDNANDLFADQSTRTVNNVKNLEEELLEILYRREVVPFDEHPQALDRRLHRTVKVIPTPIESENNEVARIVKLGFRWRGKVLRPEEVEIKRFNSDLIQTGGTHG